MSQSRQHQEAHGIGQIEQQLNQQADAAEAMQGGSKLDQDIRQAADRDPETSLDEVVDP